MLCRLFPKPRSERLRDFQGTLELAGSYSTYRIVYLAAANCVLLLLVHDACTSPFAAMRPETLNLAPNRTLTLQGSLSLRVDLAPGLRVFAT